MAISETEVLWTAGGICGEAQASIFRAELTAVLSVLRIAIPPLSIHVDNAQVVQGFIKGRGWCTNSKSCAADLSRTIWDVYDGAHDLGGRLI